MSTKTTAVLTDRIHQPAPSPEAAGTSPTRYFEFVVGSSAKFWEASRDGCELTTRWGRIGSAGQSQTKSFPDEEAAVKAIERLIAEKTGKGYVER